MKQICSIRRSAILARGLVGCALSVAAVLAPAPHVRGDDPAQTRAAAPENQSPAIDPRADELLRAAGKYLGDAKSLSFSADVWEDVVSPAGRKLQSQRSVDIGIRRPDRIVAHTRSAGKNRDSYYDGKSLTIYDASKNFFGVIPDVPKSIDETVDFVSDRFGMSMPLADLVVTDLHRDTLKDVRRGDYLGLQKVAGATCHHLGFVKDDIDWQIWIEEGAKPLVRKLVITHKGEDQAPQFVATISQWNLDAALPDYAFQFRAPAGASKIDVLPAKVASTESQPGEANLAGEKREPAPPPNRDTAAPRKSSDQQPKPEKE